jgi:transposase-like protein
MPRAVTIENVGQAFEVVKAMQADGLAFGDDHRPLARAALAAILEERMAVAVERHLDELAELGEADRRNGGYARRLLTALGSIELAVPRTRRFSAGAVLRAYARREAEVDRMILASFVLGLSTRKVGEALLPILGERVSAATVSQVAKTLDAAVAGFHARPLKGAYRQLVLDGVVLARRTGAGALRRPVLVALGIRADGRKEVIDFCLAGSESAAEWERFLTGLHRRGLTGAGLEMICVDGGQGLLAALPTVYPGIAVQRCWAHKIRNVLNKVRKTDQPAVKRDLHAVMNAPDLPRARAAARHFAERWREPYPKAVACLRDDLDDLLACFRYKTIAERRAVRTTNAIERRFREVRRRTRPMGVFSDRTSMHRILFAIFTHENRNQGVSTPFPLTQTF